MNSPASAGQDPQNRRRQYFIKRAFQGRFILQFTAFLVLACITFGLCVYLYSKQTLTTAFVDSKLRVMSTADFLLPALGFITLLVAALVAMLAAARLLLLSHKIAGPLYRLEKSAKDIGQGNLNLQIRLRSGDELQELAKTMDEMVRDLRTYALEVRRQNERLRELIAQASQVSGIPQDFLRKLKEAQDQLNEAVSRFQV